MSRQVAVLWVLATFAATLPLPLLAQGSGCPTLSFDGDGRGSAFDLLVPSGCVLTLDDRLLGVRGTLTVAGTLVLADSVVLFNGSAPQRVVIEAGGRLDMRDGVLLREESAAYSLEVRGTANGSRPGPALLTAAADSLPPSASSVLQAEAGGAGVLDNCFYLDGESLARSGPVGTISNGDLRLSPCSGKPAGSMVGAGAGTEKAATLVPSSGAFLWFVDRDEDGQYDRREAVYLVAGVCGTVCASTATDHWSLRVKPTLAFSAGSLVKTTDADVDGGGTPVVAFPGGSGFTFVAMNPSGSAEGGAPTAADDVFVVATATTESSELPFGSVRIGGPAGRPGRALWSPLAGIVGASGMAIRSVARPNTATLANLSLIDLKEGILVESSTVLMDHVVVAGSDSAGLAVSGSKVRANDALFIDNAIGFVVGQRATLEVFNGTVSSLDQEGILSSSSARLFLNGTLRPNDVSAGPPPPSTFEVATGALVEHRSWLSVQVLSGSPPAPVRGATVELRDAANRVVASRLTNATGWVPPLPVLNFLRRGGAPADVAETYEIVARKEHNVATEPFSASEGNRLVALGLPNVPDDVPPSWEGGPEGALTAANGEFTKDGEKRLAWPAATDGEPPHGISHYAVYQIPSGGTMGVYGRAPGTSLDLALVAEGPANFRVAPVDLAGNQGPLSNPVQVYYDKTPPSAKARLVGQAGPDAAWFRSNVVLNATPMDLGSGIQAFTHKLTGPFQTDEAETHQANLTFDVDGSYVARLSGTDRAGNVNTTTLKFGIDRRRPNLTVDVIPREPNGPDGWYRTPPQLVVNTADDGSGVHETRYRVASNTTWSHVQNGTFRLNAPGTHTLIVDTTDRAGNTREIAFPIKVDTIVPRVEWVFPSGYRPGNWSSAPVEAHVVAADADSGLRRVQVAVNAEAWTDYLGIPIRTDVSGSTRIFARAMDKAGNLGDPMEATIRIDSIAPVPGRVAATSSAPGRIDLDWGSVPPTDGESGIASVRIERRNPAFPEAIEIARLTTFSQTVFRQERLAAGTYDYRLHVSDLAQNEATTPWASVTVDEAAAVRALDASYGSTVSGKLVFSPRDVATLGEPVQSVALLVDGEIVAEDDVAPYAIELDTTQLKDGRHGFSILVRGQTTSYEERGDLFVANHVPLTAGHEWFLGSFVAALAAANGVLYVVRRRQARAAGGAS